MKAIVATLNAKYIHTSLALRWLYVANKDRLDIRFREFTIKEETEKITDELLATGCDVICLSVYIWNVERTGEIIRWLKQCNPRLFIIIGGPEVTYEPAHFLQEWPVDYVISGEGEFVLGDLIEALAKGETTLPPGVSSRDHISQTVCQADITRLAQLPSPYQLEEDREELKNRLVYVETSRGCPYQCQYCLSSREKGVRYFPMDYVLDNLKYLIEAGARQIKFLDRTFNLNKEHTRAIFEFLIDHYREGLSCQFEVYADLLTDEMIDWLNERLPTGYFRFEIGIQSTYEPTNRAIKRQQDFPLLAHNIRRLMAGGKVVLHLDLIAGLPYETFDRFVQSFNEVFALEGEEVQLGFLKMLRGTNLRRDADRYGYQYAAHAPYEIVANDAISATELHRIHEAEHALEKYWNSGRFKATMRKLFSDYYPGRYFQLFDELGQYYEENHLPHRGYLLEDLFRHLHHFLLSKGIDLYDALRTDYYSNFTQRPRGYWMQTIDKKERKKLLYAIGQDKEFLLRHRLTRRIIEKQTAIDPLDQQRYLLTIFPAEGEKTARREVIYHRKSFAFSAFFTFADQE
ncbi:B12-binding domain-containing radical SAM protein [Parabacteroides sp. PFB2-10]|uniref:B12-binding domain-containing radical SAM protein n=1 Tax=Parabacteroides sp. PFB2-10 TaxID=1742405 RepID=UPI002473F452|nr:B12-binding domain-containing radical SAM protein [Parabacteroides sp. PFB2-10]